MSEEEIIILKRYCQEIIDNPLSIDEQFHILDSQGKMVWCRDWEIIEILKYLFNGHSMYMDDPPPHRLKECEHFVKDQIAATGKLFVTNYKTAGAIVDILKKRRLENAQRITGNV